MRAQDVPGVVRANRQKPQSPLSRPIVRRAKYPIFHRLPYYRRSSRLRTLLDSKFYSHSRLKTIFPKCFPASSSRKASAVLLHGKTAPTIGCSSLATRNSFIFSKDSRLPTVSDSTRIANNERELIDRRLSATQQSDDGDEAAALQRFD